MDAIQQEDTTKFQRVFQLLDADSDGIITQQEASVLLESLGLDTTLLQDIQEMNLQQFANFMATMQLKQPNYDQFFAPFAQNEKIHAADIAAAINKLLGISQGEIAQVLGHIGVVNAPDQQIAEFVNGLVRQ